MVARPHSRFGLRPFLPEDAAVLADIFRASIEHLTEEDYNPSQQEAWAATADDVAAFAERLASRLTIVATFDGQPVGFVAIQGAGFAANDSGDGRGPGITQGRAAHIDMLYVHPEMAGQGAGATLCDAAEKLAAGRGATDLTVDSSDTAYDFFLRRGFAADRRNTVAVGNEWLSNTTMKKPLAIERRDQ